MKKTFPHSSRALRLTAFALVACAGGATQAQAPAPTVSDRVVRIGVLNDRSGPLADLGGEGSAVAARMAAAEFGNKVLGVPVEIIVGDHQNKTDLATSIARKWFDVDGVDVIVDVANSAVSLAIAGLVKERKKVLINTSGAASLTGKACAPRSAQWLYNIYSTALNQVTEKDVKAGLDSFYIITVDYAYGHDNSRLFTQAVTKAGGKIVGEVKHPANVADFSSYLLQAQASGAKGVFFATTGGDLVTALKQANEFGLAPKQTLFASSIMATEIEANGLDVTQGLRSVSFYEWNLNPESTAWAKNFSSRMKGRTPSGVQAATYSQVRHYLNAVQAAGTDDADTVLAKMREMPVRDAFTPNGRLREDGQMVHDMYVFRVKKPSQSKVKGDYNEVLQTIPAEVAFQSLQDSECPHIKK